ncbi:kinase-like domain-containing protein [Phaeosphaeriaceae sp. PMI808]|nr:kinase-like domain-containing protein [Phaeosphaeriaceae sp. PMI808]
MGLVPGEDQVADWLIWDDPSDILKEKVRKILRNDAGTDKITPKLIIEVEISLEEINKFFPLKKKVVVIAKVIKQLAIKLGPFEGNCRRKELHQKSTRFLRTEEGVAWLNAWFVKVASTKSKTQSPQVSPRTPPRTPPKKAKDVGSGAREVAGVSSWSNQEVQSLSSLVNFSPRELSRTSSQLGALNIEDDPRLPRRRSTMKREKRIEYVLYEPGRCGLVHVAPLADHDTNGTSDLAERLGWQIGADKFLMNETPLLSSTLTRVGWLGKGTIGEVDEVEALGRTATGSMARKRIDFHGCSTIQKKRKLEQVQKEIESIKSLRHPHIITLLGTYQEGQGTRQHFIWLLMYPVGDQDLGSYLSEAGTKLTDDNVTQLNQWMICLTSALTHMHACGIFHEDIKPANIICRGSCILFTDFSSCRRVGPNDDTSTMTPAAATRLFAAPEAMPRGNLEPHGSTSDVFSLGLVFVEMLAVLSHYTVDRFRQIMFMDYTFDEQQYHRVLGRILKCFERSSDRFMECLQRMLRHNRTERPKAKEVLQMLVKVKSLWSINSCDCAQDILGDG